MKEEESVGIDPIVTLQRDLKKAAATMEPSEARLMVDYYYLFQKQRVRANNQIVAMEKEPHDLIRWIHGNIATIERNIKTALGAYALGHEVGQWSMAVHGIGPVISAGLIAHIDIARSDSVSKMWSFAGLNPTAKWGKGKRRPWNARLKVICWHVGECFKRTHTSEKSFYGRFYRERKMLEESRNDEGLFRKQAEDALGSRNIGTSTEAYKWYKKGMLPPGRLDLRACRYATKLFLSHWWQVLYSVTYGKEPPVPWILTQEPHTKLIKVPGWPSP